MSQGQYFPFRGGTGGTGMTESAALHRGGIRGAIKARLEAMTCGRNLRGKRFLDLTRVSLRVPVAGLQHTAYLLCGVAQR